ncbi:ankyrin repeat-containing protein BDA1-like [Rhodamnia argentea]|uniref:Ankyrin repeat-containing protein BDA1-like n=1 Tax=Rhodamnia argentea TaxID=178133 RepID=A0A8B8MVP7_9MYRT|nr:ankyrin repeat-containing protein BDA1-like [Rhodamnia argentea]
MNKLHEVAMRGDLAALQDLLLQDPQILHKPTSSPDGTPLHVSCLLGHTSFTKQLLTHNPELAKETDSRGSLPLHVACAKGHVEIVRALLAVDPEGSLRWDREGRTPLHLGAIKGRAEVLGDLIRAKPEAARVVTSQGESAFHLCVKSNRVEALKVVVGCVGRNDEFVGCRDKDGNTILHLAVARKQLELIKYLLSSTGIEVNAQNAKGFTALDVLSEGPRDLRDMEIKQLLQRAGASLIYQTSLGRDTIEAIPIAQPYVKQKSDTKPPVMKHKHKDWLGRKRSALIVVASLIATVAFQATLSPPGGFWQDDFTADPAKNGKEKSHHVGMAVMATSLPQAYGQFMIFNTLAFLSSLSIILLVVSGLPMKRRRWMWTQMVTMWIAITALTFTYFIAWIHMTPEDDRGVFNTVTRVSVFLWLCLMGLVFLGNVVRMVRWFSRKFGHLKVKEREASTVVEENEDNEL